jgi:Flp pilus assembly protein TadG
MGVAKSAGISVELRPRRRAEQSVRARRGGLRRLGRSTRAAAAVEFALTGLALLGFILAILNLGMFGFSLGALVRGVQSAARAAAVEASASYASNGTLTCPAPSTVVSLFNTYADPPLPVATGTTGNPAVTSAWTDNSTGAVTTEPQGVYLTLTAKYKFVPIGFSAFGTGVTLSITTVATVLGSSAETATC